MHSTITTTTLTVRVLLITSPPVQAAQVPVQAAQALLHAQDSDIVVQYKLVLATRAAEAARPAEDFWALPIAIRMAAMGYLCVDSAGLEPLQDAFLSSTFTLCQRAAWAADPALSHGILSTRRRAFLNLMRSIRESSGGATSSRARMQAARSAVDFQACEQALAASGETFADIA
jgi:hypothetical protein